MEDLRVNELYLNEEERDEWNKRNIVYNTIWFYVHHKKVDVEYSPEVFKIYKKNLFFAQWGEYRQKNRIRFVTPDGRRFYADLMTGWWNPFRVFMGLNKRSELNEELLKKIPEGEGITEWIQKKSGASIEECNSLLSFMEVIYTAGNMIPAPKNWPGRGSDTWDYKLKEILSDMLPTAGIWNNYIENYYDGANKKEKLKSFVEKNCLEMYFENLDSLKLKTFWENGIVWTKAKSSDWSTFFNSMRECIIERNEKILNMACSTK